MECHESHKRAALKEKLLKLFQAGAASVVLASATVDTPQVASAPTPPPKARITIEERVDQVRKQLPAEPGIDESTTSADTFLAWYNWHNWRNGWGNGWHNWHNWRNWW